MATPTQPMPDQGVPPQGGAPSGASGGQQGGATPAGAALQLVAIITRASDQLKNLFPAAAPMADEIQNQLRLIQSKMSQTQSTFRVNCIYR